MNDKYGYAGESAQTPRPATAFDQVGYLCNEIAGLRNRVDALSAALIGGGPKNGSAKDQPSPSGALNKVRYDVQMALGMISDINESLAAIEREVV